ncbi:MAG: tetratricopeptide repeat protein [Anaerolineae bacterium]|nr:tetratricopeptide repeat protein [Anaerolineae bacterium]
MPEHIFISYARADGKDFAGKLHDQLEIDGFTAWLDIRDIQPGNHWDDEIDKGIRECWALIFVMTPGSIESEVCHDEWTRALSFKKAVLPLKLTDFDDTEIPFRLARRQYLKFDGEFDPAMARLRQRLQHMQSPAGQIDELKDRQTELKRALERADDSQAPRLRKEIDELAEQIAYKERALREPEAVKAENRQTTQAMIDLERERLLKQAEFDRALTRRRVVGSAPQGVSETFRDRDTQFAEIINTLLDDNGVRVVSIYGRGGAGKTALACKVLHELEKDYARVHGVVYLSTRVGLGIGFEQIYTASAKMLGGETETALEQAWKQHQTDLNARIQTLIDHYGQHKCIILLDNLEDLLDAEGHLTDAELKAFVDAFLRQQHGARLLITSREPLNPANDARRFEKVVPLDEGLPEHDSVELLKALDADGDMGLKDADENLLKTIAAKTHGYPRALEAVAGILDRDPLLTAEKLLANADLWRSEVTEALVREAQSRLDADARRVMQALAVYGRPVREAAVRFLLEPYADEIDVPTIVRRLARGKYVTVKRNTGELVLHPLDKEVNYNQIPAGLVDDYNRESLERRAGNYYVQLRAPMESWKTIDDLAPQLAEFEHRVKAGDYDSAARLLRNIDFHYLMLWGHSKRMLPLREQLLGKIEDKELTADNLNMMGLACWCLGQTKRSIRYYEQALLIHREADDKWGESAVLGNLGLAYSDLGEVRRAIAYYEQALVIQREIGDRRGEGTDLGNLGNAYYSLGEVRRAIDYYEQALVIKRDIGDRRGESINLGNLGLCYREVGQYDKALDNHLQGLKIVREIGARSSEGYRLNGLGDTYLALGQYHEAQTHCQTAVIIADEIGMSREQQEWRTTLALTHLYREQLNTALEVIRKALTYETPDSSETEALHGLVLTRLGSLADACAAFERALVGADTMLAKTAELYEAKYTSGLALAGLAVCGDPVRIPQAIDTYRDARANCDAVGVLAWNRRLLDELAKADANGILAPVRAVLE